MLPKNITVTREQQDEFAYQSHQRAFNAKDKLAQEIIPIEVNGEEITTDQSVRPTTTLEQMGNLRTVFDKKELLQLVTLHQSTMEQPL
jgi:Acetyl-CoA acetyltransferase